METAGQTSGVQSIDRAVALLTAFSRTRPVLGISELARHTQLTRGTTHRLVSALAANGMLSQVPNSHAYCLGPRLLGLVDSARDQLSLDVQAPPVMTWLRDETEETVGLHVLDATPSRRTIAQVESRQPLRRTYTDLGTARPPHQGAPSKVLLAYAPNALTEHVLSDLARTQPEHAQRIASELEDVRTRGYAISLEERVKGVVALAVPIWNHEDISTAALSISIPAVRAGHAELTALAPLAQKAAAQLSQRLGHRAPPR